MSLEHKILDDIRFLEEQKRDIQQELNICEDKVLVLRGFIVNIEDLIKISYEKISNLPTSGTSGNSLDEDFQ